MTDTLSKLTAALADRYRVDRELGAGGMATVYLAEDLKHHRQVAVKVLRPELASAMGPERFMREIEIAARLQHPHILAVYDSGEADGLLYYVMPYVEGESLAGRIARDGALPTDVTLRILREVADALAYAHARDLVHRDIKPDNILLSGQHALVADFGIARAAHDAAGERLTATGLALGTPTYMAPEQASGEAVDQRADIYALGVVAYEMLAGEPPFRGSTAQMVVSAHLTETPTDIAKHRPALPPALASLVMRCLEKHPADRVQTADEVLRTLDSLASPSGGFVPTGTAPVEVSRSPAMHRVAMLFAAASLVILGAAYGLMVALGLPDWVVPAAAALLVVGLPMVLTTSRVEGRRAPGAERHRFFNWRRALRGGAGAFAALAVAVVGYMGMRTLGIGPVGTLVASGVLEEGGVVVLSDFVDRTGDASLARTVTEAIRVDLSQSRAITIMSPNAVRDALQRMQRNPDTVLTESAAREIANREGLKAILTGEVSTAGGGYVLTASLVSAETGDVLTAQRATASDSTDLIAAMDRLSVSLRERVGESLKAIRARDPLLWATTGSLPALRRYTDGNRAVIAGDTDRGIDLLREAVALDTTFAEAYRKLAVELGNARISRREELEALTRAYRYRDRLPDATRYLVEGTYHNNVTRDNAAVIRAYKAAIDVTQPGRDRQTAYNNLAVTYWITFDYEREREYALKAVEAAPDEAIVRMNAIVALMNLGRLDSARTEFVALDSLAPGHIWTQYTGSRLAFAEGEWALAKEYSAAPSGGSPADPFYYSRQVANVEAVQGRLDAAVGEYERAERLAVEAGLPQLALDAAAEHADLLSTIRGDTVAALRLLEDALTRWPLEAIEPFDRPGSRLALAQVNAGDLAGARLMLEAMEAAIPQDLRTRLWERIWTGARAALAVEEGRADEAVRLLTDLPKGDFCEPCGLPALAAALDRAGNRDSAVAVAERYATMPHANRIRVDGLHLGPTLFRLAEMFEAKGDTAKAVEYYGRFTELWKDADPDLQARVKEARARIAQLSLR